MTDPPRRPGQIVLPPGSVPATSQPGPQRPAGQPPALAYPPLPVGRAVLPGQGPGFALTDHVHQGVARVRAGTNVTVTGTPDQPIVNASGGGGSPTDHRFWAYTTVAQTLTPLGANSIICIANNPVDNPLGDYNPATGRYTVSKQGTYLFLCTALWEPQIPKVFGHYGFNLACRSTAGGTHQQVAQFSEITSADDQLGSFGMQLSATLPPSLCPVGAIVDFVMTITDPSAGTANVYPTLSGYLLG